MDEITGEGVCIIDLDTVMPGLVIYDFGDSIRFGANHSAEDETDLSKVNLDIDLFAAYTAAFIEGTGGSLTNDCLSPLGGEADDAGVRHPFSDRLSGGG